MSPASAEVWSIHDRSGSAGRQRGSGAGRAAGERVARKPPGQTATAGLRSCERRPAATLALTLLQVQRQEASKHASQERDWVLEQSSGEPAVEQVAAAAAAAHAATAPATAASASPPARCPAAAHWCHDRSPVHPLCLTQLRRRTSGQSPTLQAAQRHGPAAIVPASSMECCCWSRHRRNWLGALGSIG